MIGPQEPTPEELDEIEQLEAEAESALADDLIDLDWEIRYDLEYGQS